MPGICAIVATDSETNVSAATRSMLDVMRHHEWYVESHYSEQSEGIGLGRMTLGIVNASAQPATTPDGSLVAVLDGELYDLESIARELGLSGHEWDAQNHARLLLLGYQLRGSRFLRQLSGSFVAAIWQSHKRQLTVITDRFATRPLYFANPIGRFIAASSIAAVMTDRHVPRDISPRGLSQFFTFGHFLADDTMYEAVRVVPAASSLTYDANSGTLTIDRYWSSAEHSAPLAGSRMDQIERIDQAFKAAIDRRTESATGCLGLALSGGLDARTILAVVDHERVPVKTLCLGMAGSRDHRSSKQLATIVGCQHYNHTLDQKFLADFETHFRDMVRLTDGQYLSQCIIMPTLPVYRDLGIQVLLRGHGGELLHMCKAYNYSLDKDGLGIRSEGQLHDWLARRMQAYLLEGVDAPLFDSLGDDDREELADESLRGCLAPLAQIDHPLQRIWHLFLHQRVRRETMVSMVKFNSVVEPRLPYLDNEFVSLVLSADPEMKLDEKIQAYILRKRRKEFLKVANTNTGTIVGAGPLRQKFASLNMRILSKLGVPGYQPYERMGLWLRRELAPLVQRVLLGERCLERGVFNPDGIRTIVSNHQASHRNHTFLLLALMTFELGQQIMEDPGVAVSLREMSTTK
jgi:asparagine synthase (glutamine-hydrolysing)